MTASSRILAVYLLTQLIMNKKWFCQLSVGLESPEDIIEDLDQALKAAGQGAEES